MSSPLTYPYFESRLLQLEIRDRPVERRRAGIHVLEAEGRGVDEGKRKDEMRVDAWGARQSRLYLKTAHPGDLAHREESHQAAFLFPVRQSRSTSVLFIDDATHGHRASPGSIPHSTRSSCPPRTSPRGHTAAGQEYCPRRTALSCRKSQSRCSRRSAGIWTLRPIPSPSRGHIHSSRCRSRCTPRRKSLGRDRRRRFLRRHFKSLDISMLLIGVLGSVANLQRTAAAKVAWLRPGAAVFLLRVLGLDAGNGGCQQRQNKP